MSEFDPLEESVPPSSSSASPIALAGAILGLVGIVVGVTGIVMARGAAREVASSRVEVAGMASRMEAMATDVNTRIDGFDQRLERVGSALVPLQRDRGNLQQVIDGMRQFQGTITQNREAINELNTKLAQLAEARPAARAPAPAAGAAGEPAPEGTYIIQSGDTYGRIAQRFGTTISAIEAANPGVDPRRLQIGQRINLPRP